MDELSEENERLVDSQRFMFLYNALSEVEDFRQIRQTMDIHDKPDNYDTFLQMAEKAAVIYDKNNSKVKVKQKINETNMSPTTYVLDENEERAESQTGEYDTEDMVDLTKLDISNLSQQQFKKKVDPRTQKEQDQAFQRLPIALWNQLDKSAKDTIMKWLRDNKGTSSKPQGRPPPKPGFGSQRTVNNHEIDPQETVDENQDQDTDDPEEEDALLSLLLSQDQDEKDNLANVLSAYAARRGKAKGFTPPKTKQIKFNVVY